MRRRGSIFGRRRPRARWRSPLLLVTLLLLTGFVLAGLLRPQWFLAAEFARQRWLAGAEQHSVVIDGQRWNYLEAGQGPPLLLLHGFTGSKENWLPVIGALSRQYRVLAPDLPGWGLLSSESARPPHGYSGDAGRLAGFVEAMVPQSQIHLVGHSMGGGVAAVFAARWPQRVERLVLMSAGGVEFDNPFSRAVLAGGHPFAVDDRESLRRFMRLVFRDPPWVPWPVDAALIRRRVDAAEFEREVLAAISSGPDADAPQRLAGAIQAPTLLFWCRGDRVVDLAAAAVYAEQIPDSRLLVEDDCNHMPMMERPAVTAAALLEFLGEG